MSAVSLFQPGLLKSAKPAELAKQGMTNTAAQSNFQPVIIRLSMMTMMINMKKDWMMMTTTRMLLLPMMESGVRDAAAFEARRT